MKKYSIDFNRARRNGEENLLRVELERPGLTNRDFKVSIIGNLFSLACESIKNKWLSAYITCDGKKVLTVRCHTEIDGSNITAYVYAARPREKFHLMRVMAIAE